MKQSHLPKSMAAFAAKLYEGVMQETSKNDNIFFGNASIYAVISMIYYGADGTTAEELKDALCLPEDSKNFADIFFKSWMGVIKANNTSSECCLDIANRVWLKDGVQVEDDYLKTLTEKFLSDAVNLDFLNNLEQSEDQINKWVSDKTRNKIQGIVQRGKLAKDTTLLVTNAMYFYGEWLTEFETDEIESMPFHISDDEAIDVDMMYRKATFAYEAHEEYDCKVLLLPYRNSSLRFLMILPNEIDGIFSLEKRLCEERFNGLEMWNWSSLRHQEVHLYLPKFQITQKVDLVAPLRKMGLDELFGNPNLSGISKINNLLISGISHAAFIDVNEKGTEVAAYTESSMKRACISRITEFRVDHPFLFMVVDKDTEMMLFLGRVCKPSS